MSSRNASVRRAQALAAQQAGVVGRRQLYRLGLTRWQVTAQLRAARWRRTGRETVSVHSGVLDEHALRWRAVLEVGPRAALDGVSALQAAGLRHVTEAYVHVIAPKSSNPRRASGVVVHESRRFREEDVIRVGVPRVRPPVAAVHAALWAATDRQAALFVAAAVQQRLATGSELLEAVEQVRRHPRRAFLRRLALDVVDGAQALGELDLLRGLRRRGLPLPVLQAVRVLAGGRAYLDADWPGWGLAAEVDGSQHDQPGERLADTLRDLDVAAGGTVVLRIPLLALRLDEEAVLDRIEAVFRSRGWRPARDPRRASA